MIFVTVGHQQAFDRMIKVVDRWAGINNISEVYAQVGNSAYPAKNFETTRDLSPDEFDKLVHDCELVIAHAGTGTIIKALEFHKPLFVMPRKASLGETRNDHQLHTVRSFAGRGYLKSFDDENELAELYANREYCAEIAIASHATEQLISAIAQFINEATENTNDA